MFIHLITFSIDEGKLQGKIDKATDTVRDFKTPLKEQIDQNVIRIMEDLNSTLIQLDLPNWIKHTT